MSLVTFDNQFNRSCNILCIRWHSFNGNLPGQAVSAGIKMSPFWILQEQGWRRWWWQLGTVRRAKLQSNHHYQQSNIRLFYRPLYILRWVTDKQRLPTIDYPPSVRSMSRLFLIIAFWASSFC